jgi:hypothetical protein
MVIALLAVLVLSLAAAPVSAAASEPEPALCASKTLHDYLAPLKRMPELRELPFRRRAEPFFRGVRIGASGPSLAVSGRSAGYQLQWDTNPKWDITVTLARVSWRGKVGRHHRSLRRGILRRKLEGEKWAPVSEPPSRPRSNSSPRERPATTASSFHSQTRHPQANTGSHKKP